MIGKILNKVFTDILWPKWLGFVSKSDSPKIWGRVFNKSAETTNTIPVGLAVQLSSTPSVLRLMLSTFKPDRNVPTAKDFAVSIAFELDQQDYRFNTDQTVRDWQIRNFSSTVRREWLSVINESPVLKSRFKDVRDKHPSEFLSESAECTPDLDSVLNDKTELKKSFFKSYTTPDATEKVIVWLPGDHGSVERSPEERITVEVGVNAALGADLGFFRMGHDYSLYDTSDKVEWLRVAYRDDNRALETMDFGFRSVGVETKHMLWVR
ncbi:MULTISPECIES: hypothetical protein [Idiomarina]|jgi:hypothetical protein|uniref:hypothetical protein n=1 Tax=Idiomarina TaxID=135575 RepID=UPI000C5E34FB|nr:MULTISPECIES: hypothetical protein [Idiomarina]MBP59520.1 hypothetical protein [Idiomarina sp.]|tara:strand:+ start:14570 stop:15367 length:798 start_codon:yes stop_codon:yes gene_type:complete